MNKKFVISSLVLAIASLIFGFLVHGTMLYNDYARLPGMFRSDAQMQHYFPYMLMAHLSLGIGLTWIYRQGHQAGKGILHQGLRFGAAIAVVSTIPMYLIYFAVQPMPSDLVAQQIVFDTVCMLALGLIAAWLNK